MLDASNPYYVQMVLLMDLLRVSTSEACFALKGGTAINLFYRDLPRLSVDIDLTYLPLEPRKDTLKGIETALERMADVIAKRIKGIRVVAGGRVEGANTKLMVSRGLSKVKMEVSTILRGSVKEPELRSVTESVENVFGSAEARVLSFQDIYAGKICAALDRQHPRDFFDVKLLLENEGIADGLMDVFLVYLLGGDRPIAEMLAPNPIPLADVFRSQFQGMALIPTTVEDLNRTRHTLIAVIQEKLTGEQRRFLLTFKSGDPDWDRLGLPGIEKLPSIQWKLQNIRRMDPGKREQALESLRRVLKI